MSGSSSGSRIKSIFDSDDESDEEKSSNLASTPSTLDKISPPKSSSSNIGLSVVTTKEATTPDSSAVTPAQMKPSSSSSSRVAASSTAALFARLQKTPPIEVKKASLENKDDCSGQKDESKKESLFVTSPAKVKIISENKDISDSNVLNIRKLDERPKGPKKELLDKFIHMNENKIEKDALKIITESTLKKETAKITDVSGNEKNVSIGLGQKTEINKFEPEALSHDNSLLNTKEKEKSSEGDSYNDEADILGKKEKGEKRGGSPLGTDKAEKIPKHDRNPAFETNTEVPEQSISSAKQLQTGENPKITIKSSASTIILGKSEGSPKFICTPTLKSESSPNLILKSIAPKLLSSGENIPKLILKTSSPGSKQKSIEGPKLNINTTESLESTIKEESIPKIILKSSSGSFDRSIESQHTNIKTMTSPESTRSVESIPKIIVKKSENSESVGSFGKSPKVTVKNYSFSNKEVSKSSDESPKLAIKTEFTPKNISSAKENPQMLTKSVFSTGSESCKPMDGSLKLKIGSSGASELSNVDKTNDGSFRSPIISIPTLKSSSVDKTTEGSLNLTIKNSSQASDSLSTDKETDGIHKLPIKSLHASESSSVHKATEGSLKLNIKKSIQAKDSSSVDEVIDERHRSSKSSESSNVDKATEESPLLAIKSSHDSESSNVDKSPEGSLKLTIKKPLKASEPSSLDEASDGSCNTPIKSPHVTESSSIDKAAERSLKLTIKKSPQAMVSSSVHAATEGSLKFTIKSSQTSESSSVDKVAKQSLTSTNKSSQASESSSLVETDCKISSRYDDNVDSEFNVKCTSNLSLKSPQHNIEDRISPKKIQNIEKKDKPAIVSYSSNTMDDFEKVAGICETQTTKMLSPVYPNRTQKKSTSPNNSIENISKNEEKAKAVDNNTDYDDEDDNDDKEYCDKKKQPEKSIETPIIKDISEPMVKTDDKLQIFKEKLSSPQKFSVVDENVKQNVKSLVHEEITKPSHESKPEDFKEFKISPKLVGDEKNDSKYISTMDQSLKETLEAKQSTPEVTTPRRVGKLLLKIPNYVAKDIKENKPQQFGMDLHKKPKEDNERTSHLQPEKLYVNTSKGKDISVMDKKELSESESDDDDDDDDDIDQSKDEIDDTGDDRTSEVNTTVNSNVDDPGSSDEDSSSDDSSDSDSERTANSTLESIADKANSTLESIADKANSTLESVADIDDDEAEKYNYKENNEDTANSTLESITDKGDNEAEKYSYKENNESITDKGDNEAEKYSYEENNEAMDMVTNTDKFREDFINKIEKTSSPMRKNVQENKEDEDMEINKKDEQDCLEEKETSKYESCEKEEKSAEVDYDYDDLNKDYEEDSDESRMEIVEEEMDETVQKKTDELKMEEVKVDNQNKSEMTIRKLQDTSIENITSDVDVETVYRRELDTSSKAGFVKTTSTPKIDVNLKKVRVEDVFTDTEDEKEDDENEPSNRDDRQKSNKGSAVRLELDSSLIEMSAKTKDVNEVKSTGIKAQKISPKTKAEVDMDAIMKPLERGWIREVVQRNSTDNNKSVTKTDIYYCSPEGGKKLRSGVEIESHLLKTGVTDLTRHNFAFLKKPLGLDEKYEVIRYSTSKTLSTKVDESESVEIKEQTSSSLQLSTNTNNLKEANSEGIKAKKSRPKPKVEVDIDAVMKAFERGWQREIVYRSQQNQNDIGASKKLDIYYYSPEGKKLRSRVEIESHLLRTGVTDLSRNNFTWVREPLGLDEKHEIVRYATPASASKASHFKGSTPVKSASPTPGLSPSSKNLLKRIRPIKAKFDPSLEESSVSKRPRSKGDGPPTATFRVKAAENPLAPKSSQEAGSPSLPSSKTSIQQLPGHKNISFRTISKATPPKKLVAVPAGLNASSPASMRTYSRGQLSKIQQQNQVIDNGPHKGNTPSNRNQVVYTSSICSRQPPVPRIITPALGKSERSDSFHCTPHCPRGGGNVPSLSCIKCLTLFHPDCCFLPAGTLHLIHSGATKFLCPNCFSENKANATAECEPLSLGCEPLAYDPTDSEDSDEEMPAAGVDTVDYFRVGLIAECPPTPPRSPPPSQEDIQARTAAAVESQWMASSQGQDPLYGIPTNMPMRPNIPGQQGNPQVPGNGQLLQVQSSGATQRFLFIRASGPQATSQGGVRSNMPTKIFLPSGFPGSQTMPMVLPQKNVSSGQSVSIQKIMPTKWTQTGPLPKPKPPIRPPFMSTLVTDYTIMLRIFSYLHIKDLLVASQVSLMWRDLAASPRLWVHVSLRNICVSNWKLLARFMDRRGTQSVDLRKMRMKAPLQKIVLENERRDSLSPIKDKTKESDQGLNNENSNKDNKIEESVKIKEEVMDVEENLGETTNDDSNGSMTDESKEKEKNTDISLSPMEVNDPEEGKNLGNKSNVTDATESNRKSIEENENDDDIKEKEIKTEDISSILVDKPSKEAGALEQWREICHCLRNMERLRSLTLPSCQAEMVHQVLQNCNHLTSLTAIDIKTDKQNEQMPSFDPSYLMDASELTELRLASSNGFSFTSNFNFIKLQKLKVLVVRGLSETVWPYLGTNLTTLHIGPLRNFTASNWSNIGAMKNLEALWLEDGGNLQDISVYEALHQLTCLKRLCLFNFVVGPRLHLAVKKMTKLQKVFVLPSKEIDVLSTQNGHMLSVAENTKQCSELVWAIWADEVMDKDGKDSIVICPSKIHLKVEGSKRPQEGTEIWSFKKLHGIVSKNLPRSTVRIMKLESSHATLMAMNTL